MRARSPASIFAIILGLFFLVEGVWGLFSPVVFETFTTNTTHAIIHIVLGFAGVALGLRGHGRPYDALTGLILLAVGVMRFIPETRAQVVETLNLNVAGAYANLAIGAVAIIFSVIPSRRARVVVVEERPVQRRRLVTNV